MKETNRNRAKAAKRRARQRKLRNRRIALTVCLMLVVIAASVSGTIAWLTDSTEAIVNTFTYGNIDISLAESKGILNDTTGKREFKIVPGVDIPKDPTVTVTGGSEDCWLFVKVDKTGDFISGKVTYAIADDWTQGNGIDIPADVYYRAVEASAENQSFGVLKDNKIKVSDGLTKEDLKEITNPTLTFTAYAVQKAGIDDAATAWKTASTVKS